MTVSDTRLLSELIGQKHDCLLQLRDLGRQQDSLIENGEMTQLLDLLALKQRLLEKLQATERGLDPFRDESPEQRIWHSETERGRCAHLLVRSEALLKEIVNQEKDSESRLRLRRDEASARLQSMHTTREAHGAYVSAYGQATGQLDLTSEG